MNERVQNFIKAGLKYRKISLACKKYQENVIEQVPRDEPIPAEHYHEWWQLARAKTDAQYDLLKAAMELQGDGPKTRFVKRGPKRGKKDGKK